MKALMFSLPSKLFLLIFLPLCLQTCACAWWHEVTLLEFITNEMTGSPAQTISTPGTCTLISNELLPPYTLQSYHFTDGTYNNGATLYSSLNEICNPQIISDYDDNILAIWCVKDPVLGDKLVYSTCKSGLWTQSIPLYVASNKINSLKACIDKKSGTTLVTWTTANALMSTFYHQGKWNEPQVLTIQPGILEVVGAIGANSHAGVIWSQLNDANEYSHIQFLTYPVDELDNWQISPTNLSLDAATNSSPRLGITCNGNAWALWKGVYESQACVFAKYYDYLNGWKDLQILSTQGNLSPNLALSTDSSDICFATWTEHPSSMDSRVVLAYTHQESWIQTSTKVPSSILELKLASCGSHAISSWILQGDSSSIIQYSCFSDGIWSFPSTLYESQETVHDLHVALDESGGAQLTWVSTDSLNIEKIQTTYFQPLLPQFITFNPIPKKTYGDPSFELVATASSGLAITYSLEGPGYLQGNVLTITGSGFIQITAHQVGDATYHPANDVTQILQVNKTPLIITASPFNMKCGSPLPRLSYTVTGLKNTDTPEQVLSGELSTEATSRSPRGKYTIAQGSLKLNPLSHGESGYDLIFIPSKITIYQAQLTIIADKKTITYGDATPVCTYRVEGLQNGDVANSILSGSLFTSVTTKSPPGQYPVEMGSLKLNILENVDYTQYYKIVFKTAYITVKKAHLVVTAHPQSMHYGDTLKPPNYSVSGLCHHDTSEMVLTGGLACQASSHSPAGKYPITQGSLGLASTNIDYSAFYTLTFKPAMLTIYKAQLTVIAAAKSMHYGSAPPTLTYTAKGFRNDDNLNAVLTGNLTSDVTSKSHVGKYIIKQGNVDFIKDSAEYSTRYKIVYKPAMVTVYKRQLTVTPIAQSTHYGEDVPELVYTVDGFCNAEVAADALIGSLSCDANPQSPIGTYLITHGTLALATAPFDYNHDYLIVLKKSLLTIQKATLNIILSDQSLIYGSSLPQHPLLHGVHYTLNGFVNNDGPHLVGGSAYFSNDSDSPYSVGSYSLANLNHTLYSPNYDFVMTPSVLNVMPATLTVHAQDSVKTYGDPNPSFTYTIQGYLAGDDNSVVHGAPTLTTTALSNSSPGSFPINVDVSELGAANYIFQAVPATLTIVKSEQTIELMPIQGKRYGDSFDLCAVASSGLDVTFSIISGPAFLNGSTLTVCGVGPITIAADQPGDDNYLSASQVQGRFLAGKAILNVVVDPQIKEFGNYNPPLTYHFLNFKNGDSLNAIHGRATLSTLANNESLPGDYPISIVRGSLYASNYLFNYISGWLHITEEGGDRLPQTIYFDTIAEPSYGNSLLLHAKATSYLPIHYTVLGPAELTDDGLLKCIGVGEVSITAWQDGNEQFLAADPITQIFSVTPAMITVIANNQTCTYGHEIPTLDFTLCGFQFMDSADTVSGAPILSTVATSESPAGVYSVEVNLNDLQADNYCFNSIPGALTITKCTQSIECEHSINTTYLDDPLELVGVASSGLPVIFSVVSGPGVLEDGKLSATGAGVITLRLDQPGNENYLPSTSKIQSVVVDKAKPTLQLTSIGDQICQTTALCLEVDSPSPSPFIYAHCLDPRMSKNSVRISDEGLMSFYGSGPVTVTVSQVENENFYSAQVSASFLIYPPALTVSGTLILNDTLMQINHIYRLDWSLSQDLNASYYNIYRNGTLLYATDSIYISFFLDRKGAGKNTYYVEVVNNTGQSSASNIVGSTL